MTQLTKGEHAAQMESMKAFDEQMPCLTPKMVEEAAEKGLPFINYPHLHRQVWAKEYFSAQAKQEETRFKGDYTLVPCGCVTRNVNKFIVLVSKWAEPFEKELVGRHEITN